MYTCRAGKQHQVAPLHDLRPVLTSMRTTFEQTQMTRWLWIGQVCSMLRMSVYLNVCVCLSLSISE